MKIWAKDIPNFAGTGWVRVLLFTLTILLIGLAGGLASWLTRYFAGKEVLIPFTLLGLWLVFLISTVKFDFMVLITFCLLSLVRIEPAPVDGLSMMLLLVGLLTRKLSPKALKGSSLIHLTLWIFLIANLTSLIGVKAFFDSLRFLIITVYLIAFAYFVRMYVTSFQAMRNVMLGYLVSVTVSVFLVALGYLGVSPFRALFLQYGIRALGAFKDSNVFGPFLIPMIILLIDEIFYPRIIPRFHPVKIFGVIVLITTVLLSFSRAAWGNLALALFVYFILQIKDLSRTRVNSLLTMGVTFLLLILVGLQVLEPFLNWMGFKEFLGWRASSHDYDWYRFARQQEGIYAGLTHLFGVGPGVWDNAHSLYARTFAEHGILGFASIFLLILALVISTFRRALQETKKPYGLSAKVVLACLVGFVLNSAVIDTIHWRHFWLILALAWVVSTQKDPSLPDDLG